MRVLRARLHQLAKDEADAEATAARRSQVRTVDRSERIRTYNFPENRITDHRTGFKAYNLDAVLDGDLDPVVQSCARRRRGRQARRPRRRSACAARDRPARRRSAAADGAAAPTAGVASRRRRRRGARRPRARRRRLGEVRRADGARRAATLPTAYADLVDERAARVPLQHLTGRAHFRRLTLAVGPGVFVPRPETEVLAGLAMRGGIRALGGRSRSGRRPVHGVGRDRARRQGRAARTPGCAPSSCPTWPTPGRWPTATGSDSTSTSRWATRRGRASTTGGRRRRRDEQPAVHPGRCRAGRPRGARPRPRGRALRRQRGRAGHPARGRAGGRRTAAPRRGCSSEHADSQGASLPARLGRTGEWVEVIDHPDLGGRPRVTRARRAG